MSLVTRLLTSVVIVALSVASGVAVANVIASGLVVA